MLAIKTNLTVFQVNDKCGLYIVFGLKRKRNASLFPGYLFFYFILNSADFYRSKVPFTVQIKIHLKNFHFSLISVPYCFDC